jgi:mannosyltransferase OCH1-like enzyme
MRIPRHIHQLWKDAHIPPLLRECQRSWKILNPGWKYTLWTDRSMQQWVDARYPQLAAVYARLPSGIQRADMFRYLLLSKAGGVYADLDFECLKPLDHFFRRFARRKELVLGLEPYSHARYFYKSARVFSNAFIASVPGHPLWPKVIAELSARVQRDPANILFATGTILLTDCVKACPEKPAVIRPRVLFPVVDITQPALPARVRSRDYQRLAQRRFYPETCAVHYWQHSNWPRTNALTILAALSAHTRRKPCSLKRRWKKR